MFTRRHARDRSNEGFYTTNSALRVDMKTLEEAQPRPARLAARGARVLLRARDLTRR